MTAGGTTSASPPLYTARPGRAAVSWHGRLIAVGVAVGCLTVLVTAAGLRPSPSGVGSHRGLGLQSCAWLDRTGLPCPSCGMTTSFTWFARGNLAASVYVQPMGALLAAAAACCVWGGAYVALTGRPLHRLVYVLPARAYLIGILGFAIAAWGWKVFIRLRGLDGWR